MNENLCLPALPNEVHAALFGKVSNRKNRNSIMDLAAWIMSQRLHLRSKKGFTLVRGSTKDSPDGLKERADLQMLGLTADKIRGAIKILVKVGFLDKEATPNHGWRINFRNQARNPPCIYRVAEEYLVIWRKVMKEIAQEASKAIVAAKAVATRMLDSVRPTSPLENHSSALSPTLNRSFQNRTPIPGDFPFRRSESVLSTDPYSQAKACSAGVHDWRTESEKAADDATWARWRALGITRPE